MAYSFNFFSDTPINPEHFNPEKCLTVVKSIATASSGIRFSVSETIFPVFAGLHDVHIGTGPEEVALAPLQGLPYEADCAVGALQVVRDVDQVSLGPEN